MLSFNVPDTELKRVVIIGGGFGGLTLARALENSEFQVVLIDKNNYHQFQPLFYQVAMSGLEPSSIVFPFRKIFQKKKRVFIRVAEVESIDPTKKTVKSDIGVLKYDILVLGIGADTNFFGNQNIMDFAIPMKSVSEALFLRNRILEDYETALTIEDPKERQFYTNIVVVGGGPTGVEIAGALAEMRNFVLKKDYPDLDISEIDIHLITSDDKVLMSMSEKSGKKAENYLRDMGVDLKLEKLVIDYDGSFLTLKSGEVLRTKKVIWAAGIISNTIQGLPETSIGKGKRIKVDAFNKVFGIEDVYALGDVALMEEIPNFPNGHPQVAQPAIQQSKNLANNLKRKDISSWKTFKYKDLGSMATIGRNAAVADLPGMKISGFFAWVIWMVVHLFSLFGGKNKIIVFINWVWSYLTYDQSLRLLIKPFQRRKR
jgi:NADH:ubiquinone reductase (H+-translocating)